MYTLNELYRERAAKKSTLCDTAVRSGTLNRAVRENTVKELPGKVLCNTAVRKGTLNNATELSGKAQSERDDS